MQYQTLNPYSQIIPGIQAGLQLGSMRKKEQMPNDAIIADPGEYQPVKIGDALQDVEQDLTKYVSLIKNKKIKKLDPEGQKRVLNAYLQGNVFNTPIIQELVKNHEYINPEELTEIYKSIKNGTPEASGNLQLLFELTGSEPGTPSDLEKAFRQKMAEIDGLEKKNREQRGMVLARTLDSIQTVKEKYGQYLNKGMLNPQTKKVVTNELNYIKELANINPEMARRYWDDYKTKTYKPRQVDYQYQVYDPDLKRYVTKEMTAGSIQDVKRQTGAESVQPFSSNIGKGIYKGSELEQQREERKTLKKEEKFEVGKIYKDAKGRKVKYLGNDKWRLAE